MGSTNFEGNHLEKFMFKELTFQELFFGQTAISNEKESLKRRVFK